MGMGFLMGVNFFHGYEFGIAKPGGFVPVAISILESPTANKHKSLSVMIGALQEDLALVWELQGTTEIIVPDIFIFNPGKFTSSSSLS
jgi:hypothetical protein